MILICVDKCFVFCVMSSVFQKLIPLALEPVLHGEISSLREVVPVLQAGKKNVQRGSCNYQPLVPLVIYSLKDLATAIWF